MTEALVINIFLTVRVLLVGGLSTPPQAPHTPVPSTLPLMCEAESSGLSPVQR